MVTIAIPRAADCHRYTTLWRYFFENLGFDVILSPETTKAMVDAGVKAANTDICFAIKVYYGHILELQKQKFDYLFVPSTIGSQKQCGGDYCCAYFAALPSIIKSSFGAKVLTATFYTDTDDYAPYLDLGNQLGIKDEDQIKHAFDSALKRWLEEKETKKSANIKKIKNPAKRVALIGLDYVILDKFCDMDIPKLLEKEDVEVVYSSDLTRELLEKEARQFPNHIQWHCEKEMLGAIYHFIEDEAIDGIILIFPFSCGPCFLLNEQVIAKNQHKKKFLTLNIDESQNEGRIRTRIEAFLDIINRV
jgi:predicted nucleotide-binding protein (sugar kinase/HSP70/actin superfamily)